MKEKSRERWVDYVKVIACCLVVLGHFFQSMVKSGIMNNTAIYNFFNTTIYYFHVPLFFVCSGYLYQKYSSVSCLKEWIHNVKKKGIALGIPYFTFSIVTLVIKRIFENTVNSTNEESWLEILFNNPVSPYWYLYVLFFAFILTPTVAKKKEMNSLLLVALLLKLALVFNVISSDSIYIINKFLSNEIWFVLGMSMAYYKWNRKLRPISMTIVLLLFIIISAVVFYYGIEVNLIKFLLGLMACISIIGLVSKINSFDGKMVLMDSLGKFTMPIFLMHTIFAAGLRSVLVKLGISNLILHCVLGIGISFVGPIIAAYIMKKSKWLEIFLYPGKFIK